jgi:hypothetical protein
MDRSIIFEDFCNGAAVGTAARAESNRTEASAIHCNVEVADAVRLEEGEFGC